jgi:hypothetical protein
MSISATAYWFLEAVRINQRSVHYLGRADYRLAFNMRSHGLSSVVDVAAVLAELVDAGLIGLSYKRDPRTTLPSRHARAQNEKLILREMVEERRTSPLVFGLTRKGGSVWETLSSPDWNRYCNLSWGSSLEQRSEFIGESLSRNALRELMRVCFETARPLGHVDPGSLKEVEIRDWRATYWKRFTTAVGLRLWYTVDQATEWSAEPERVGFLDRANSFYTAWTG